MDGIDPGIVLSNGYTQVLESKRYGGPLPMDHILTIFFGIYTDTPTGVQTICSSTEFSANE